MTDSLISTKDAAAGGLLRALVDEVKDNERRFLEWWAIGTKGVRFPKPFRFFEQHRVALLAAENALSQPRQEDGLDRRLADEMDAALRAALPAQRVADAVWQERNDQWVPVDAFAGVTALLPCPIRSSLTDAPCVLRWGHECDSPTRFHRYARLAAEGSDEGSKS